ncbi:MAG: MGDG synthase family glycosyltransferase, partial [Culicoidibacterales bacterium]
MEALILSCGTGGGHDMAAAAISEAFIEAGHTIRVLNPYTLISMKTANNVDQLYLKTVRYIPSLFGFVYWLGVNYERFVPMKSPVYWLNHQKSQFLSAYLATHHFDVIVTTHVFPGQLLTALQNQGEIVLPIIYSTTDYVCTPFTAEVKATAYVIAHEDLYEEFERHGLNHADLYPLGIPVKSAFRKHIRQAQAKRELGLTVENDYWLIAGGSIGIKNLRTVLDNLVQLIQTQPNKRLIIITGSQANVNRALRQKYADIDQLIFIPHTQEMATYLQACELYFSKPGGLASTEAIVAGIPLILIQPLPGGEPKNQQFFVEHGL